VDNVKTSIDNSLNAIKNAFRNVVQAAINALPKPIQDALKSIGFVLPKVGRSAMPAPTRPPAPPPTTRTSSLGASADRPAIVINIGSVRDARDIDAIERAVARGMDEAARRGIVQSQLPRGI